MTKPFRVGIYARVSTSDKDQDPETQLIPLREYLTAQCWEVCRVYVDYASAADLAHRKEWRELLDDASKRKLDLVLVWKMDRAFRSVLDAPQRWKGSEVGGLACVLTQSLG